MKDKRGTPIDIGDQVAFLNGRQFHSAEWKEIEWGWVEQIFEKKGEVKIKFSPPFGGAETRIRNKKEIMKIQ